MKITNLFLICYIVFYFSAKAQVGVGTTTPNAQLDVRSSNQATPSNIDGILIPKVDEFPVANPTIAQDGLLVYASGNGSVSKGYYYWDNGTSSWFGLSIGLVKEINDLLDGKSDSDGTDNGSSIFLGILSGVNDNSNDHKNVGVGYNTLFKNVHGKNNVAIGHSALFNTLNTSGNIAIGTRALYDNDSGSGNVGIGIFALQSNIDGLSNTAVGNSALNHNINGGFNVGIGRNSGDGENGTSNVFLGAFSGFRGTLINRTGSVFIGTNSGWYETNSNRLHIENSISLSPLIGGSFSDRVVSIDRDINQVTNTFEVNGNASKSTTGAWLANSDKRLKKNISSITGSDALDKISRLSGVSYKWNDKQTGINRPEHIQYGFIAQELMKVFPENVTQDKLGYYQTAYGDYDAFFVEAIKELKKQLNDKDEKLKSLEERISKLEAILSKD